MSGKHHLSPAEREAKAHLCYELSLKGLSTREIGAHPDVQLSHPTVANLIAEEAEKRRSAREDHRMKSVAMKMKTVERMWEELDSSPSAHAVAQLGHAVRGLLADIDMVVGTRAPTSVHHKVSFADYTDAVWKRLAPRLTGNELTLLYWIICKADDDPQSCIPEDVDLVELAFERYRRDGKLHWDEPPLSDFPPKELESRW